MPLQMLYIVHYNELQLPSTSTAFVQSHISAATPGLDRSLKTKH